MDWVCPLCNGLEKLEVICNECHSNMKDGGKISDYYDDYSPYLPISVTGRIDGFPPDECIHLFYCSECGRDKRMIVEKQKL